MPQPKANYRLQSNNPVIAIINDGIEARSLRQLSTTVDISRGTLKRMLDGKRTLYGKFLKVEALPLGTVPVKRQNAQ